MQLHQTLCDHAAGNYRILTAMSAALLSAAAKRAPQLGEKRYLEVFAPLKRNARHLTRPQRHR